MWWASLVSCVSDTAALIAILAGVARLREWQGQGRPLPALVLGLSALVAGLLLCGLTASVRS